jgi:hypothetical protein
MTDCSSVPHVPVVYVGGDRRVSPKERAR